VTLLSGLLFAILSLTIFAWWGSNTLFHPPKMLPLAIRPDRFGLPYEDVSFITEDGLRITGWLIACAGKPTDRTILLCHGWGDNKGDLLQRVHFLAQSSNLFLFDSRSHGDSEGTITTDGWLEARDLDAALAFLTKERSAWAGRLGVFGLSMGAVMAVRGMAAHPELRCGAFEAPFRTFNEVVARYAWNSFRLPAFPFAWAILMMVRLRLGTDIEPMSPLYHLSALGGRPKLFIAGERDRLMPLEEQRSLHAQSPEPKDLYVVPGAPHGRCWELGGEAYRRRLLAFFDERL
jgi:pimeloyl-ACP methyl ester carboxylesterase